MSRFNQDKIVLLACGSFNPPTYMHLRLFEVARDHYHQKEKGAVVGGIMSPVHDAYKKKDLVASQHRVSMCKIAIQNSDWIRLSDWESLQECWSTTKSVLEYHQKFADSIINANEESPRKRGKYNSWFDYSWNEPVKVKLLCGGDLLESFNVPGLWKDEDIETIVGKFGIVVVTREGSNPEKFIYESDILSKFQNNIEIVTEWISNDISSTKVRRAFRRGMSTKYLLSDLLISYIKANKLYCDNENQKS